MRIPPALKLNTIAFSEPCQIDDVVDVLGRKYRIVAEMTRQEYLYEMRFRRALDRDLGFPPARRGVWCEETKEFRTVEEPGPEYAWCYRVEPL